MFKFANPLTENFHNYFDLFHNLAAIHVKMFKFSFPCETTDNKNGL